MATAATNAVYSQVFKKKLADVLRVGTGGGLCFCGINMYFKNEKFYDDWVMPLFGRLDPDTAHAVAQQAAKYNLVPKAKLQESRLLVSTQPSSSSKLGLEGDLQADEDDNDDCDELAIDFKGSTENLISSNQEALEVDYHFDSRTNDSEFEPDDNCPRVYVDMSSEFGQDHDDEELCHDSDLNRSCDQCGSCPEGRKCECEAGSESAANITRNYLSELSHYRNDLRACDSPKHERNCVTPDSPSLSMRVNIASPLRSSKMSLATVMDGANPAYDHEIVQESPRLDKADLDCRCQIEECIVSCKHDDGSRTDIVHIVDNVDGCYRCDTLGRIEHPTSLNTGSQAVDAI